ncbi:MAG TPA: nuclear transport factor 2 family protein [Lysobacter sp.]|nr:nuclear transport factor 2 family protein [Lysobacter sp.]
MVFDEIRAFLGDYFEVLQTQDMELFDRVFHKDCVLYSQQDGNLVVRPYAAYREIVQGRQSPASKGALRQEEVLLVDLLSPTMVVVKVRLRLFDNIMEDHLNLMKHEGRWMVYAKHFHRAAAA